ncbi:MAG: dTDP-4-dehydrorhamnose reductase [Halieaceae bacterium]
MRVLLIGADTSVGLALRSFLTRWGRHELVPLSSSACRWKSERQAKKAARRASCEIIIDTRIVSALDSGEEIHELDIERCHWLAKACQRSGIRYLYLSNARVYAGSQGRPYTEFDQPDNQETIGQLLCRAESVVKDTCDGHLILRLGPIFSARGVNSLTHVLERLDAGGTLMMDNNLTSCPVDSGDAARVIAAIIDQVSTGADAWGVYNYASSDATHCYEFAEALLASASQFSPLEGESIHLAVTEESRESLNRTLECSRILNTFAIKQVPWRGFVTDAVKQYFELQQQD